MKNTKKSGIDLSYLLKMSNNDHEFVIKMLKVFVKQIPDSIADLKKSETQKKWDQVASIAHKVKSNYKMILLEKARADSYELERMIKDNNIDEKRIKFLVKELETSTKKMVPVLKKKIIELQE